MSDSCESHVGNPGGGRETNERFRTFDEAMRHSVVDPVSAAGHAVDELDVLAVAVEVIEYRTDQDDQGRVLTATGGFEMVAHEGHFWAVIENHWFDRTRPRGVAVNPAGEIINEIAAERRALAEVIRDRTNTGADLDRYNLIAQMLTDDLRSFTQAGTPVHGANLSGLDLADVDLCGVDLSGANLSLTDLSGADLRGTDLSGADLRGVPATGADFRGANLDRTDMRCSDLLNADLRLASVRGLQITGSRLDGMRFSSEPVTALQRRTIRTLTHGPDSTDTTPVGPQV